MSLIKINYNLCCKDYICIEECPSLLLVKDIKGYPTETKNAEEVCINCGHCVAVCSRKAITHKFLSLGDCIDLDKNKNISKSDLETFLMHRRSIRQYNNVIIKNKIIIDLLKITRYAPTARNLQPVKWMVLKNNKKIYNVTKLTVEWMKNNLKKNDMLYFKSIVDVWEDNKDRILRKAPVILIGYAHKKYKHAKLDVVISMSYVELAALSVGLGTCWAGYFISASQYSFSIKKYLGLPKNYIVYAAMMLGFSKVKYHCAFDRKYPSIIWI